VFNLSNTGWQWVHVDVQIVLECRPCRKQNGPTSRRENIFFLVFLVEKYGLAICAIHMNVANIKMSLNFDVCIAQYQCNLV
jgi:hypothetical protein